MKKLIYREAMTFNYVASLVSLYYAMHHYLGSLSKKEAAHPSNGQPFVGD
jgi:hypothetical protein